MNYLVSLEDTLFLKGISTLSISVYFLSRINSLIMPKAWTFEEALQHLLHL